MLKIYKNELISPQIYLNLNRARPLRVSIIGEVNIPGKYDFLKNNLNIFEAIGIAGGLTINGKRNDIKKAVITLVEGNTIDISAGV